MGIGYILGCLLSVLLWRFDRQVLMEKINDAVSVKIKNTLILQVLFVILGILICYLFSLIKIRELSNFVSAFIVIDISNTERKNLRKRERVHFYDSISTISRSMICGFLAPLFYIAIGGNVLGIAYSFIYNVVCCRESYYLFKYINNIMNIVPALFGELILYPVYAYRNKSLLVDFKGDFLKNLIIRPLLNVDILAAFLESVNFYYYFDSRNTSFIKSYGNYNNKIDEVSIKDYLSIAYGVCLLIFIVFFIIIAKTAYK